MQSLEYLSIGINNLFLYPGFKLDMCKKTSGGKPLSAGPPKSDLFFASYPIFALGTDGQGLLISGGGGGGKSYGVLNYIQAHVVIQDPESRSLCVETIATMDTGTGTPIAIEYMQGGVWACSLGDECLLFRFSDDSLTIEPLFRFKTEISGDPLHVTNFVRLSGSLSNGSVSVLTGGEDKIARLWRLSIDTGSRTISQVSLVSELPDHKAEVVDGDWQPGGNQFLTCGKDGSVKVWNAFTQSLVCTIEPRSIDKKQSNTGPLAIRSALFVGQNDVVVLCHHSRGPAFLMLYSISNPGIPIASITVSRSIATSMAADATRSRVAVSQADGQKTVYAVPSLKSLHSSKKNCHQMPPGRTLFVFDNLVVSGSPDFSLSFFDPLRGKVSWFGWLLWLILVLCLAMLCMYYFVPEARDAITMHVDSVVGKITHRVDEL